MSLWLLLLIPVAFGLWVWYRYMGGWPWGDWRIKRTTERKEKDNG